MSKPIKFSIITLGCKVNQYESEALERFFEDRGLIFCDPRWINGKRLSQAKASDVYIVNTCTVTQKAAMQSRQIIRQAIRSNPEALIIVTGCYAQTRPDDIISIPGVHSVLGHFEKSQLYDHLCTLLKNKNSVPLVSVQNIMHPAISFQDMPATPAGKRTRPFLKIQDGCSAFCTYCIVPYARGKSRSLPLKDVLEKIRNLKNQGYHETVLTGIHLGAYGQDLFPPTDLYKLLLQIRDQILIDRVRLSSIEPGELNNKIIELAVEWKGLCSHFHIPLQSGDNAVLEKMRRPYHREFFQDLVLNIRNRLPHAAIGVDCLMGFPGETPKAFQNTYDLIEKLPVTYLHVFPFSPRKDTPAWGYAEKISQPEIKYRCRMMRDLGDKKKKAFFQSFLGKKLNVLVEHQRDYGTGLLKAMSSNYISALIQGPDELKNTMQSMTVTEVSNNAAVFGML
ncbi:MAG: tRNA (N(6)-L-threonylcarbamoyladenosine(37)-C(2))-methylthiotransferase MtaB [Desulfobacterales bacterium]